MGHTQSSESTRGKNISKEGGNSEPMDSVSSSPSQENMVTPLQETGGSADTGPTFPIPEGAEPNHLATPMVDSLEANADFILLKEHLREAEAGGGEVNTIEESKILIHLREHMNDYFDEKDLEDQLKMESDEEMEFHYFKLHDYDGNNKLDGLELGAAMTHFHHDGLDDESLKAAKPLPIADKELATLVNQILKDDDLNDDGYVDYYEFVKAQREKEIL